LIFKVATVPPIFLHFGSSAATSQNRNSVEHMPCPKAPQDGRDQITS
jgi:hypothetical protein